MSRVKESAMVLIAGVSWATLLLLPEKWQIKLLFKGRER